MSDILEKFSVFSEISEQFKQNIKLFHVFGDLRGKNVFIVTNDDKVFAFGSNNRGQCGFGHSEEVNTPQEIPELNGKQIKQFFIGFDFVLALNENNHVFGWGENHNGQLGRGYTSEYDEYLKPKIIRSFVSLFNIFSTNIIEISCGNCHILALDEQNNVFSWGHNLYGQVGCGKESGNSISRPVQLKELPKIKTIHCYSERSFAVTFDGLVYSWGQNSRDDIIYKPGLICGLNNVISVGCSGSNTYFLRNKANIYFCGEIDSREDSDSDSREYQFIPKILETDLKFQSIQTTHSKVMALSEETVYYLQRNSIQKTKYKSFIDYCLNVNQTNHRTIELIDLDKRFEYLHEIGTGHFGKVHRVEDKILNLKFAVKIVKMESNTNDLNSEKALNHEVNLLTKCNEEFVAKYYNSWIDNGHFHIQMELCSNNLEKIIEEKRSCFENNSFENMSSVEKNISSNLMKEIVECVQYLHQLNPPIIHRDLKPANILVNYKSKNGRFLKVGDFGIATFGSDQTMTLTMWKGTLKYMAPEVGSVNIDGKSRYSTKADVYSLGVIFCDLFGFDENSPNTNNSELVGIKEEIDGILSRSHSKRPNCSDILTNYKICSIRNITDDERMSQDYLKSFNQMEIFENQFFLNYFKVKNKFRDKIEKEFEIEKVFNIKNQVSEQFKNQLSQDIFNHASIIDIFNSIKANALSSYSSKNYFKLSDELDEIRDEIEKEFSNIYKCSQTDLKDLKTELKQLYKLKMDNIKPGDSFEQIHNTTISDITKLFNEGTSVLKVKYDFEFFAKISEEVLNNILDYLENVKLEYLPQTSKDKVHNFKKNKAPLPPVPLPKIRTTADKFVSPDDNIKERRSIQSQFQINGWIAVYIGQDSIDSVGFRSTDYTEADIEYLMKDKKSIGFKERNQSDLQNQKIFKIVINSKLAQIMKNLTHTKEIVLTVPIIFKFKERMICKSSAEKLNLKSIKILSEPIAAAIGYAIDPETFNIKETLNIKNSKFIFLIVVNGSKCYGTIFLIANNLIELYHTTDIFDDTLKNFKQNMTEIFKDLIAYEPYFNEIIVVGQSKIIEKIREFVKINFHSKFIDDIDSVGVIITGSIIYGLMASKENFNLHMVTRINSCLHYEINCNQQVIKVKLLTKSDPIIYKGMKIDCEIPPVLYSPDQLYHLYIFENYSLLCGVELLSLPKPNAEKINLKLQLEIKELVDIQLKLFQLDGNDIIEIKTKNIDVNEL